MNKLGLSLVLISLSISSVSVAQQSCHELFSGRLHLQESDIDAIILDLHSLRSKQLNSKSSDSYTFRNAFLSKKSELRKILSEEEINRRLRSVNASTETATRSKTEEIVRNSELASVIEAKAFLMTNNFNSAADLNQSKQNPLAVAIEQGRSELIEPLIKLGAIVDQKISIMGLTALMVAAEKGDHQAITTLIQYGADINATAHSGGTALAYAIKENRNEAAHLLMENGADINKNALSPFEKDYQFQVSSPLTEAAKNGNMAMVDVLLKNGVPKDGANSEALGEAIYMLQNDIAKRLVKEGFSVNASDADGNTPLHMVRTSEQVKFLLAHGANPKSLNKNRETPLKRQKRFMYVEEVKHELRMATNPAYRAFIKAKEKFNQLRGTK